MEHVEPHTLEWSKVCSSTVATGPLRYNLQRIYFVIQTLPISAIQDAGIPVDMVGGVSIGAFMGALYCIERNTTTLTQKAREWSKVRWHFITEPGKSELNEWNCNIFYFLFFLSQKMTQWYRQLLDLTYPITSMFTGKGLNQSIIETFGDVYIEDLWIPYFTLTTDISASCSRIHTNGSSIECFSYSLISHLSFS